MTNVNSNVYKIINLLPDFLNDVPEIIRAFQPHIQISDDGAEIILKFYYNEPVNNHIFELIIDNLTYKLEVPLKIEDTDSLTVKSQTKRIIKNYLYKHFVSKLGVKLAYGSLTGVRPTSIIYRGEIRKEDVENYFKINFFVTESKAKLINDVHTNQIGFYCPSDTKIDLFINIPICKTKCKYCSFPTAVLAKSNDILEDYINCILMEIELKRNILENYEIGSIYVGGGTPTCIPDCLLDKLLKHLSEFANNIEFTVEAGRPDSISLKNLNIMANNKVSRISINPQTFNEDTLIKIGRNHNVDSIYEAYELSRLFSFCINMDLIAGLPDEHEKDFISSLNKTIALSPDNITVHSLSIKRGSIFMEEANKKDVSGVVTKMVDYSQSTLVENGYIPYYLYRQKNTFDNLENVGYCKPGKQCRYNINYMEETNTVLGLGAGAMTKFVFNKENRIERVRNKKNIELYMTDIINLAKH